MTNGDYKSLNKENIINQKTPKFCVKMKPKTADKIGLFSAIMVILGAMIGIGIFLKNGGIFKNNNGNPYGILTSWLIVIVIAICTAYSFGEISRVRTAANAGLGGWSSRYINNRFGRFVKLMYPLMYYSIVTFAITFFLSELIFKIKFGENNIPNDVNFWYIIIVSVSITVLLITFSYFCENLLRIFFFSEIFFFWNFDVVLVSFILDFILTGGHYIKSNILKKSIF